jgi:hypothetical protein
MKYDRIIGRVLMTHGSQKLLDTRSAEEDESKITTSKFAAVQWRNYSASLLFTFHRTHEFAIKWREMVFL